MARIPHALECQEQPCECATCVRVRTHSLSAGSYHPLPRLFYAYCLDFGDTPERVRPSGGAGSVVRVTKRNDDGTVEIAWLFDWGDGEILENRATVPLSSIRRIGWG